MQDDNRPRTLEERFQAFHAANPRVYEELVTLARQARARTPRRIGIELLMNVLRWNRAISTTDSTPFKINQNYASRYARALEAQERCSPECQGCSEPSCLAGFFEFRVLRTA